MASLPISNVNDLGELSRLKLSAKNQDPAALRAAAKQFEAMFTQQLLKSARAAKLGDDLMGSEQGDFYQDMFDQQISQSLAGGKGLGIAELLIRQLQHSPAAQTSSAKNLPLPLTSPAGGGETGKTTLLFSPAPAQGTAGRSDAAKSFITQILPHSEKAAAALGVPAQAIAAQAALETGWGQHVMRNADGTSSNNLFGIKADASWNGARVSKTTDEYVNGQKQSQTAEFRSYGSLDEAFADYARFLKSNPRYRDALNGAGDFAQGLQKAGYATDPAYAQKISSIASSGTLQLALNHSGNRIA